MANTSLIIRVIARVIQERVASGDNIEHAFVYMSKHYSLSTREQLDLTEHLLEICKSKQSSQT